LQSCELKLSSPGESLKDAPDITALRLSLKVGQAFPACCGGTDLPGLLSGTDILGLSLSAVKREQLLANINLACPKQALDRPRMSVLHEMNDQSKTKCPRCGEGRLRGWEELNAEERMVAERLPEAVDYTPGERRAMHRWCTNCWYENAESAPCDA
jgi:hypothetical protein